MEANAKLAQLPTLSENNDLAEEQVASFQTKGHILLRGVASAQEVSRYEPVIEQFVRQHNNHTLPVDQRDTYGKAFIQVGNIWAQDEAVKRFVLARRFAKIAAELMGVDGVRIYHDQALFKEPGGGHTPWHQDQVYWPLDTTKTITMWMPLVPISEEVGSMTFVDGSHSSGYMSRQFISDESHKTLGSYIAGKGLTTTNYGAMAAGDATFHAGWTLHSAPGNPTDKMREIMTIIYYADGTRALEPDSSARESDLKNWLPGIKPGEIAASPLNPLLFIR
ncbi:SnoK protein [Paenibacillus baekrokdamisoli]|uniref:SnoK protein n=1 Tax=Paenibacillus baekrokdamisoli TaxID=1712516 RepID=A0A3G9IU09_9BACL|nr:phytanoyl-CoA dioxygenase family protein [Paenibacillus baekrokdamisoli]MBB3073033.1 ectoine hydroxylase-related dioxygenase (phytanoyl-CoA dioxygenase family) [Paenibacillus baekrokdamisoli]BBH21732.1 SnoK protein [Paenibacillus baekrokdamisoli]